MNKASNTKIWPFGFVVMFLCIITPVAAQTTNTNPLLDRSPLGGSSFLGIELDKPFPGDMLKCPKLEWANSADIKATVESGKLCFFQKSENVFEVFNGPNLDLGHMLEIQTFQGKPILFRMTIGSGQFNKMATIFRKKYGPAHRKFTEDLRNNKGKILSSRVQQWEGSRLRIRLDEFANTIYWGSATIENVKLRDILNEQVEDATRNAASKL